MGEQTSCQSVYRQGNFAFSCLSLSRTYAIIVITDTSMRYIYSVQ